MWIFYAVGSAFFAGLTSILAKCGIRKTDSTVATAVRTVVILFFSWVMVFVVGSQDQITGISGRTLLFRYCHRNVLAVLLPRTSGRPCQRGGAHR